MKFRLIFLALLASFALIGTATVAPAASAAHAAVSAAYPAWTAWTPYTTGTRVTHNGVDYECLQSHTSQPGWEPSVVPALWKQVTGGGGDTSAPTVPGNLRSTGVTTGSVSLAWNAATDNVGVTGYAVHRSTGTLLGQTATTSITLSGLSPATAYQVYVRARDAAGNQSGQSAAVSFTTSPGGGGCSATATVQNQWGNGYVVQPVTVTNTSSSAKTGWTVTFTLPTGHTLAGSWNADVTVSGQTVTARNLSYNGNLAPDASTAFGFQGSRPTGQTTVPSSFTCTN